MKRVHDDYLRDMLENAEKALSFVEGMDYDKFEADDKAVKERPSHRPLCSPRQ